MNKTFSHKHLALTLLSAVSLFLALLLAFCACSRPQEPVMNDVVIETLGVPEVEIKILSLTIESDPGLYCPTMSSFPGLPLTAKLLIDPEILDIVYHWKTEYGDFWTWEDEGTIEMFGKELSNHRATIYWTPGPEDLAGINDFQVKLIIEHPKGHVLSESAIIIKKLGDCFCVEDKIDDLRQYLADVSSSQENEGPLTISDFSILVDEVPLSLSDWDNEKDIIALLGQPLYENIEVLGEGADTFRDSFIKTMQFEGIEIELFSPPDNGKDFWIKDMRITSSKYPTARGIKVGDPVGLLKDSYPSVTKVLDGRTDDDHCAYEFSSMEGLSYIQFEINEGLIVNIDLFFVLP